MSDDNPNGRFAGRRVLVTGGTSGIGLALAEAFLAAGAKVAVCARSPDAIAAFRRAHPGAHAFQADVTDVAAQPRLLDETAAALGGLDILVSNAGRLVERDFAEGSVPPTEIADEFALNLVAPIQLTALAIERHRPLEAVVLVSSGYALASPRRAPTYGAAKAGLHGFAQGLRRQFGPDGTQVLEVLPPAVDTPATAHRQVRKVTPEEVAKATLRGLEQRKPMALVGATRMLPAMLRLLPKTIERLVGES